MTPLEQACHDIKNARHESEENEARARFDRLITERFEAQQREVPKTFLGRFIKAWSSTIGRRITYRGRHPMHSHHEFVIEADGYPRIVTLSERDIAWGRTDSESLIKAATEACRRVL